jgi:RNA polymerase sigma-70 factor (ECF subfamily)
VSSRLSDEEALRRLRRDPQAVVVLYDRHVARLVAALVALSGDRELAFDLTQETFARLLERGHRVRLPAGGSAWPWLWTVARNLLHDYRRRNVVDATARSRLRIPTVPYDEHAVEELIARVDAEQRRPELVAALDALPQDQRHAVLGRVVAGADYEVLAERTGATEQALRARVSRGLRAIRVRFSGGGP